MRDLRDFPGTADLYFLRHGESEGNRDRIIQGRHDPPLTPLGREQAKAAGAWFASRGVRHVLTSPLLRASQTAEIVAERVGAAAPRLLEDLTEIGTGIFTGLSFEQAHARFPDAWAIFQQQSWEGVPEAERITALLDRAHRVWDLLADLAAGGTRCILCVTHSGFLQWILRWTLGNRTWMPLFAAADNCGVSHLRVENHDGRGGGRPSADGTPAAAADGARHYAAWTLVNAPAASGVDDRRAGH